MAAKPRLRLTDVPEKVLAWHARRVGIDTVEAIDRLQIRGDNILMSLHGLVDNDGVQYAWVWSRGDEEDYELDESFNSAEGA